ncbi:Endonuclease/exonuclease/phosphatase [Suillus tomentosus]|nr:Endonuclease/exonuclease/phosphatase [Suillus tomentosus]
MQMENLYTRRLTVLNSSDQTRPGSSAGITFLLNKEITNTSSTKMREVIPGRAAILSIKWHNNKTINILNIYAPNNLNEHKTFWEKIRDKWPRLNLSTLDFMMGDFNLTEDPIDRAPARDLRSTLKVQDLWRIMYPNRRLFMFSSNQQSLSRLDRIYTSESHANSLLDWDSMICQVPTDHQMVSVRFAPPNLPDIGKGCWSWPAGLMSDADLIKRIIDLGSKTQCTMEIPTP